jgi:hypothetical protein
MQAISLVMPCCACRELAAARAGGMHPLHTGTPARYLQAFPVSRVTFRRRG